MDQHEQEAPYEAPQIEDVTVDHGPASVAAGTTVQTPPPGV